MKKLVILFMALALAAGFTQCKKEQPESGGSGLEGEKRHIFLSLYSGKGDRYVVTPIDSLDIAPVNYELGDKMQVAYNGKYVGELTCTQLTEAVDIHGHHYGIFEGDITITKSGDQPLHFYFMGNRTPVVNANNDKLTIDISDQTAAAGGLPVISYAPSLQNYADDVTSYSVQYNWLKNQCALVKFSMENIYDMSANTRDNNEYALYTTDKDITLYGLENEVTVDLTKSGETQFGWRSNDANGSIKLFQPANSQAHPDSASMVRFAIIHHADYTSVTEGGLDVPFDPATDNYGFYGTYKIAHNVVQNEYFDGAKLDLVWHSGAFKVADAGTHDADLSLNQNEYGTPYYVVFSRGNLQYKCAGTYIETSTGFYDHWANENSGNWRFAKHQYDYVGGGLLSSNNNYLGNVVLDETVSDGTGNSDNEQIGGFSSYFPLPYSGPITYYGWIDLFGWGTGNRPRQCRQENNYYSTYTEWGSNPIMNDGTSESGGFWCTLKRSEWKYLMEFRPSARGKMGFATVCGVHGLILLPELFNPASLPAGCGLATFAEITYTGGVPECYNDNIISDPENWKVMEQNGAVFLPAGGYRGSGTTGVLYCLDFDGGGPTGTGGRDQDHGAYWTSTDGTTSTSGSCFDVRFGNNISNITNHVDPDYYMAPDNGHSVRLVHRLNSGRFGR